MLTYATVRVSRTETVMSTVVESDSETVDHCSFCGKSERDERKLCLP